MATSIGAIAISRRFADTSFAAGSSTPMTTTEWTHPSVASWPGSFRTIRWSRSPSTTRFITSCTTFPKGIPKIHVHDGKPAQGFGIFLDGRLAVYYSYQSDLGDGWEDFEVHHDPPEKHEAALRMGVNLFAYAVGYGG